MNLRRRPKATPLDPIRPTEDILADLNVQIGRLSRIRESAVQVIEKIADQETAHARPPG